MIHGFFRLGYHMLLYGRGGRPAATARPLLFADYENTLSMYALSPLYLGALNGDPLGAFRNT